MFPKPTHEEQKFMQTLFSEKRFQALVPKRKELTGGPIADPFVIACAKIKEGTVVTQEKPKPNAANIPAICKSFVLSLLASARTLWMGVPRPKKAVQEPRLTSTR